MAGVVCDGGEVILLKTIFGQLAPQNWTLKLYKNNYTPVGTSTAANFTEADFSGYSAKTLTYSSWTTASSVSNVAKTTYADQTWTSGSTQTVYGYYVVDASGNLIFAELFSPQADLVASTPLVVSPSFTLETK